MRLLCRVLILISLAMATCLAFAQEHRGVTYKLPANWQEGNESDAKVFSPKGLKEGEVVAVILTGAVETNDDPAKKQFESVVVAANGDSKIIGKGEVNVKTEGTRTACIQAFAMDSPDVGVHSRIYAMVIVGKKRTLAIVIIKPDAVVEKYQTDITNLIASIHIKDAAASTAATTGKTPTGDTPNLYPGMPGWLPSGKGLPVPASDFVNGKPQGIWWTSSYGDGRGAMTFVFLPSGVQASNPRYGGGMIVDLEGQKSQPGANGVGPFSISGGKITREYDGYKHVEPYTTGTDSSGKFFKIGSAMYRPVNPITKSGLVGTWRISGTKYIFRADGTYEFGQIAIGDGWASGSNTSGTYFIDGHLVVFKGSDGKIIVQPIGAVGGSLAIITNKLYKRD